MIDIWVNLIYQLMVIGNSTMVDRNRSESVEMYLKSVAELGGIKRPVPIGRVAERLAVSPVSANEMMKKLVEKGLVNHRPYKGVTLTSEGKRVAEGVIRKQRLWECFLVDHLEIDWALAHDLACDLEHATRPEIVESLDRFLGHPSVCPHGNPIPGPAASDNESDAVSLAHLGIGHGGVIQALSPHSSEALAYLAERGLRPGQSVKVVGVEPLDGPLRLLVGDRETVLGLGLAELVIVQPDGKQTRSDG